MHVRRLAADAGMLFVFDAAEARSFWMKNTWVALDLLFVDASCRVVGCKTHAVPHDETALGVALASQYVVELKAGSVAQHSLQRGDFVHFSLPGHRCPRPATSGPLAAPSPVVLPVSQPQPPR